MTSETEEIKKLQETITELQVELKFLQETVGVLVGAMMEEGEGDEFFGNAEAGNPTFGVAWPIISACRAEDPGSNPGAGAILFGLSHLI